MHPGYSGKRQRLADQRFLSAVTSIPGLLIEATDSDLLRLPGGQNRHNYFGDGEDGAVPLGAAGGGAPAEPAAAGVGGGLASISSTSKIRVALGPISGLTGRSPYARFDGTHS